MKKTVLFSTFLTFCIFVFGQNTWYIHNQSSHGNGSADSPFSNWDAALTVLQPGDILIVKSGRYDITSDIRPVNSGTLLNKITIRGEDPVNRPVITPAAGVRDHLIYFRGISNYMIRDIEFDGEWVEDQLIWLMPGGTEANPIPNQNLTFYNCKIHRSSRDGFGVSETDNLLIDNCEIAYCINYTNGERKDAHGIGYGSGRKLVVINSNIHHTSGDGIQCGAPLEFPTWDTAIVMNSEIWCEQLTEDMNGAPAGTWLGENAFDTKTPDSIDIAAIQPGYRGYVYLENVVAHGFWGQDSWAAFSIKFTVDATLKNCVAYNNGVGFRLRGDYGWGRGVWGAWVKLIDCISYDNFNAAIWPEENIDKLGIYNCTFDRAPGSTYFENRSSYNPAGYTIFNTIFVGAIDEEYLNGSGSVYIAEPSDFEDYANNDYHLSENSNAIDAGEDILSVIDDIDGNPRNPGSYDIGAYEYTIGGEVILVNTISISSQTGSSIITGPGQTLQLVSTVLPLNATNRTVSWSIIPGSGNATVSISGLVTAASSGTVTAVAKANDGSGVTDSYVITINNEPVLVSDINITGQGGQSTITSNGGTLQLYANVYPAHVTTPGVIWSIQAGTGAATVNQSGVVTALSNGNVTVTATATDGSGVSDSFVIQISNQALLVESITISSLGNVTSMLISDNLQMNAIILPQTATKKEVIWSVNNQSGEAQISLSGLVTPVSEGKVQIRATATDDSDVYDEFELLIVSEMVYISSLEIKTEDQILPHVEIGGSIQLVAFIEPEDATNKSVAWSILEQSGSANITSDGLVIAGSPGMVIAIAHTLDGSDLHDSLTIIVLGDSELNIHEMEVSAPRINMYFADPILVGEIENYQRDMLQLSVYSLNGSLVRKEILIHDEFRMDLSGLRSGLYLVELISGNTRKTIKINKL